MEVSNPIKIMFHAPTLISYLYSIKKDPYLVSILNKKSPEQGTKKVQLLKIRLALSNIYSRF